MGGQLGGTADIKFSPFKAATEADAGAGDWMELDEVHGFEFCYGVSGGVAFAESPCGAY